MRNRHLTESRRHYILISTVLIALLASGCHHDDRPEVVLYVSADEHVARSVISAFEEQTGIRVLMVGDTEVKKTSGLVERLRSEREKPQADVFWSSEIFMTIQLADDGLLDDYESNATTDWPKPYRDPEGRWYGFAARARVIVYAPQRVNEDEVPKTWMDLTHDRFRGRIVMADPRFGTTGGHLGAMKAYWDKEVMPGYYGAFIEGLAANKVRMLPSGNAGVVEAVARGETDLGMTDTDDVWAAQAQGLDVKLVYPNHSTEQGEKGIGTLLIPNTAAIVKGGPHREQARILMEFLLSNQVERMLAESTSHNVPLHGTIKESPSHGLPDGAPKSADSFPYAVPNPLRIDYKQAAAARAAAIQRAMHAFQHQEKEPQFPPDSQPDRMFDGNDEEHEHAK